MNPLQKSEKVTKILMIVGAVFFFGGAAFLLVLRLYTIQHSRRLARELENTRRERTFLRRLFDGIFLDPHLRGSGDGSRSRGDSQKPGDRQNQSVLDDLPIFTFKQGSERLDSRANVECSVCLAEFTEGEKGRILPLCGHCFHAECVDMWIFSNTTCPLCRTPIVKGLVESEKSAPAGRPESTSRENSRPDRFDQPSGSDGVGPSQSHPPWSTPSPPQPHVDLELGENGRSRPESEAAARHLQEDHGLSSSQGPSITGNHEMDNWNKAQRSPSRPERQ